MVAASLAFPIRIRDGQKVAGVASRCWPVAACICAAAPGLGRVVRHGSRMWLSSDLWLGGRPHWMAGGAAWPGIPSRRRCSAPFPKAEDVAWGEGDDGWVPSVSG
jgi:hypothetical protein